MTIYWLLFLFPAALAIWSPSLESTLSRCLYRGYAMALILIIGLRYRVGPDWDNYVGNLAHPNANYLWAALTAPEPFYWLLGWFANAYYAGIWVINLACAALYVWGLCRLCRTTLNPWLGLAVATPVMTVVMAMNNNRQSAALGLVFLGLVALQEGRVWRFFFLGVMGALFHKTAIFVLPLAAVIWRPKDLRQWLWAVVALVAAYLLAFRGSAASLLSNYIIHPMISDGTFPRVMINTIAAVSIWVILQSRRPVPYLKFWGLYALTQIPFSLAIVFLPSLTVIDRMAFYWMPLQIFAFANLPEVMSPISLRRPTQLAILAAYAAAMFVWFRFGNFSFAYKPYHFYPAAALHGLP